MCTLFLIETDFLSFFFVFIQFISISFYRSCFTLFHLFFLHSISLHFSIYLFIHLVFLSTTFLFLVASVLFVAFKRHITILIYFFLFSSFVGLHAPRLLLFSFLSFINSSSFNQHNFLEFSVVLPLFYFICFVSLLFVPQHLMCSISSFINFTFPSLSTITSLTFSLVVVIIIFLHSFSIISLYTESNLFCFFILHQFSFPFSNLHNF